MLFTFYSYVRLPNTRVYWTIHEPLNMVSFACTQTFTLFLLFVSVEGHILSTCNVVEKAIHVGSELACLKTLLLHIL